MALCNGTIHEHPQTPWMCCSSVSVLFQSTWRTHMQIYFMACRSVVFGKRQEIGCTQVYDDIYVTWAIAYRHVAGKV